ncbi:unnamed protein product [Notodromas monacha]|uniref:Uncharacterized protein n=1 Tax=Notodromas monacha TaxID=399045 RepID=A0A7R9BRX1_9CRUS|nr:unnamed protein product [Notodromas monacha]CAG0919667.1 unnamed protein product [Notodromas monacha]
MADAATETTPLVGSSTAALPASSTVGHGSIEVDGARETLTTFGNPTAGEIAWHRAKQFKSLILGLLRCSKTAPITKTL